MPKNKIRLVIELDETLRHKLKLVAVNQKKSMKQIIVDFIKSLSVNS